MNLKIFRKSKKNLGYGASVKLGSTKASKKYISWIPGDNSHPSSEISKLLKFFRKFDIISTYYSNSHERNQFRRFFTSFYTANHFIIFWIVKVHEITSYGSPYCLYMKKSRELDNVMSMIRESNEGTVEERRYMVYRLGIDVRYPKLGFRNRKRLRWCHEKLVQGTIPRTNYTRFRGIGEEFQPNHVQNWIWSRTYNLLKSSTNFS